MLLLQLVTISGGFHAVSACVAEQLLTTISFRYWCSWQCSHYQQRIHMLHEILKFKICCKRIQVLIDTKLIKMAFQSTLIYTMQPKYFMCINDPINQTLNGIASFEHTLCFVHMHGHEKNV